MFRSVTWQPVLEQTRCPLGNNDLLVRRYVVAVGVRNESKAFCVPGIQPQIWLRQVKPAFVMNFNHSEEIYFRIRMSKTTGSTRMQDFWTHALRVDS
jgi:hypothetical protein